MINLNDICSLSEFQRKDVRSLLKTAHTDLNSDS